MNIFKRFIGGNNEVVKHTPTNREWTQIENFKDYFNWGGSNGSTTKFLKSFGSNPIVYTVISKIAETTAGMPTTTEEESDNSVLLELTNNPNPNQSSTEFKEEFLQSYLATGNTLMLFEDNADFMDLGIKPSIKVLRFDKANARVTGNVFIGWDYTDEHGKRFFYPKENVLHFKSPNIVECKNYSNGLSPLQAGWIVVQSSDEKFQASASIFKNRGASGILTNKSDIPLLDDERERFQKSLDDNISGADKFNKVHVSTTDLDYISLGMSPTDLKLLEGIVADIRIISNIYHLPSILVGDSENSTYNNYATAVEVGYEDVYLPLDRKYNEKISSFLSEKLSIDEKLVTDLKLVTGAKATTDETVQTLNDINPIIANVLINDMTANERREMINKPPLEGGDVISSVVIPPPTVTV
jgi:HK97 family phage portal protein